MLISNVFEEYQIFGVERDVPTVTSLMEEVLGNEDHGKIAVMATFSEQVVDFDGIHIVQKVVKDNEARSALRVVECCR
jgi:hypothetical protein